jgi:hypothetical protein
MRFVTPSQNIAEYRHQLMPIYETIAAVGATTIVGSLTVGGLAGAAATAGAGALAAYGVNQALGAGGGGGGGGGGMPTYQPFTTEQQMQNAGKLFQQAQQSGIDFARAGTQANIRNQDRVTPGSSQQRQLAQNQINQYIQGQIPLDVQQNINRQVAQNLGGGFNLFSGGGQAPQNFARNIGQTSLGLSQFGLSAAPTWQQLANQMVISPSVGMQGQLQAQQTAAGLGMQNAENAYQNQANNYLLNQAANQNQAQMIMQGANTGMDLYKSLDKSGYLNTIAQTGGGIPAAQFAGSMVPLSSAPLDVQKKYGWGQFGTP